MEKYFINETIKAYLKKSSKLRLIIRLFNLNNKYPRWNKILNKERDIWKLALNNPNKNKKILLATSVGSQLHTATLESLLAVGLTLRNAEVHALLCDSVLPACFACSIANCKDQKHSIIAGPAKDYCENCFNPAYKMYQSLGILIHRFSEFLSKEDVQSADLLSSTIPLVDIKNYMFEGVVIGEHALAGALRFYARGTLDNEPYAEPLLRHYFKSALLTNSVITNILKINNYDCVVFAHGIYVPHGVIGEVCRKKNIHVVNWVPSYRKKTFIFSHYDTYHHTLMNEPVDKWLNLKWNSEMEAKLMDYLKTRWSGKEDWIWFSANTSENDKIKIAEKIGVDFNKPCIGMLTNVIWDAQLHYPSNVFSNMMEWIIETISYFSKRSDLQLLIRIHPAEITSAVPSRQKVTDEVKKRFPDLPKNIFIVPPESPINTYFLMSQCNAVLIYGTKTGVELSSMGIPVIVAGEAWIRNKGISIDASSVEDYIKILDKLPLNYRLDELTVQRARKYAYHFFFRRMIPIDFIKIIDKVNFNINITSLQEIMPGKSKGFDVICDGIIKGSDFIYKIGEDM